MKTERKPDGLLIIAALINIVYVAIGFNIQSFDDYHFVMLLLLCLLSIRKNHKMLQVVFWLTIAQGLLLFTAIVFYYQAAWHNTFLFLTHFTLYICGSFFIITQTRNVVHREGRAHNSRLAFDSLLESTPNYVLITNEKHLVSYISSPMLMFARVSRREFALGRPLIDLFREKPLKIMFADILNQDGFYENVTKIHMRGEEHYLKIVSDTLKGERKGRFIDLTDITPTVQAGLAADDARIRAEIANSAKSKFLATMSHEIRTPMNAILGISEIEIARETNPPETKDALQMLYNSGHSLLGIINDILDLSKIDTGNFTLHPIQYDTPSLIHDTVQLNIMRLNSKPIDFKLVISENLPSEMYGDELRVKQVLNNLLSNAIKYTDEGVIVLEANARPEADDEVRLIFTVSDTGQGMTAEEVEILQRFDDYSRFNMEANRATEGTGLGMSITKNLVDMMNGTISIASSPGKGSVFTAELIQQQVGGAVIGREVAENLQNFRFTGLVRNRQTQLVREYMPYGKVLVVDDLETNLYVAKGLLAPYELTVELAASGFEALARIEAGEQYDIIFMDHMMPAMDGIETTRRIRAGGYNRSIVALTANAVTGQAEVFYKNGFDGFVSKPIDIRQLDEVLKRFIRDKQSGMVVEAARRLAAPEIDAELRMIFTRDVRKTLPMIEAVYADIDNASDEDILLYAVGVHAMKSALAHVGEPEASRMAYTMEKAGKTKDRDAIKSGTPPLIRALREIVAKMAPEEDISEETGDADTVRDALRRVAEACDAYDDRAAEAVLAELTAVPQTRETKEKLDTIAQLILHSDFEQAANTARRYLVPEAPTK